MQCPETHARAVRKPGVPSFRSFHWSVMAEEDISLVVEKNDCRSSDQHFPEVHIILGIRSKLPNSSLIP